MDGRADRRLDADPVPLHRLARRSLSINRAWLGAAIALLLCCAVLRAPLLPRDVRFHPDEALFATFGRRAMQARDPLLSGEPLDKPPILFWLLGAAQALWGGSEFAVRAPAFFASLITLAALLRLGRRWFSQSTARLAGALVAAAPLDRAYAATAFADPPMTAAIVGAVLAGAMGAPGAAGALIGLAFAIKPTALQWVPLVLLVAWFALADRRCNRRQIGAGLRRFALGLGAALLALALWSAARVTVPDFWTLNLANNNPGRFIRVAEIVPRLTAWADALGELLPVPLIAGVPLALIGLLAPALSMARRPADRATGTDVLLAGWVLAQLGLLWLVAFNTYPRYLHPIAPFLLLLVARLLSGLIGLIGPIGLLGRIQVRRAVTLGLGAVILAAGCAAPIPPGTDGYGTGYQGIDQLAGAIAALPPGAIIYEHWIGWELRYYLPAGTQGSDRLIWLATVDDLIARLKGASPGALIYLTGPDDRVAAWSGTLRDSGYTGVMLAHIGHFTLVRIVPAH